MGITNNQAQKYLKNIYKAKMFKLLLIQLFFLLVIILIIDIVCLKNTELIKSTTSSKVETFGSILGFIEFLYIPAYIYIYFYEYDLRKKVVQKAELNSDNINYLESEFKLSISEERTFISNLKTCKISWYTWIPLVNFFCITLSIYGLIGKTLKEEQAQLINSKLKISDPVKQEELKNTELKNKAKNKIISFSNMAELKLLLIGFLIMGVALMIHYTMGLKIKKYLSFDENKMGTLWISIYLAIVFSYLFAWILIKISRVKYLNKIMKSFEINKSNVGVIGDSIKVNLTTEESFIQLFKSARLKWYYWVPIINICCLVLIVVNILNFNKKVNNKINEINKLLEQNDKK